VNYLLDTNACIAVINGKPESVRLRFELAVVEQSFLWIPSIVVFELRYGVAKSVKKDFNSQRLGVFLSGPVSTLAFTDEDGTAAGEIRADLEGAGTPIGPYDLLIAGQAKCRGFILVTSNAREFSRIPRLSWEDWGEIG
jgi:tRNA(fMet)-specific endonuclease VapC